MSVTNRPGIENKTTHFIRRWTRRRWRERDAAKRAGLEELHELAHSQHRLELEHVRVEGLEDLLRQRDETDFGRLVGPVLDLELLPRAGNVRELLFYFLFFLSGLYHFLHFLDSRM